MLPAIPHTPAGALIVPCRIGVFGPLQQFLQAAGKPIPPPVSVVAILDTGATVTCIQEGIAAQLSLTSVGTIETHTALGPTRSPQYPIQLSIGGAVIDIARATEVLPANSALQCLIGLDVITLGKLVIDRTQWTFNIGA